MSDTSPILSLPYIQPSQAQKHVTHNEALQLLDVLTQLVVANRDQNTPPVTPVTGTSHIVAAPASGAWAGHENEIATWDGAAWFFVVPQTGWQAQVTAEAQTVIWNGTTWAVQPPRLQNLDHLGIQTSADSTNRLAVSAEATLLSHEGAGHQLKINKSTATDTASLLFQTGWSGRAEMGTAGSDAFSIKVSDDGAAWATGVEIDPVTGKTTLPSGAEVTGSLTGTAVQQSATDTTAGRLMRADYGFGPGNLLGTVSQSAGTPTGAVIERGSNTNGEYVRFADGTQICHAALRLDYTNASALTATWTYPASFDTSVDLGLSAALNISSFNSGITGPSIEEVRSVDFSSITTTSARAQLHRISGLTDFVTGDNAQARLTAIGRWF